jgi:DNA (cytosine-5)-methyltransferase 1
MKISNMSAQDVDLNSIKQSKNQFGWKWYLKDIVLDKPVKVFSTFPCGGGSTMGYKRAGFKVLGNVELDPRMNDIYVKNHHPKYNFLMDLRDFNKLESIPDELYELDILDGSPPCSVFSTAGMREKAWGIEKKFAEGQKLQYLDDLFFVFLDTVEKLRPRVVVAENVVGLLKGNAKGYVNLILRRFKELGYNVQLFQLNSAFMGVPQSRERVFFIANRCGYKKLRLEFDSSPISFGDVRTKKGVPLSDGVLKNYLKQRVKTDTCIADISKRTKRKSTGFTNVIIHDWDVCPTITATGMMFRDCDGMSVSCGDIVNCQTFPQDYDFNSAAPTKVKYVCGMSVPPNMMANIAHEIWKQWFEK